MLNKKVQDALNVQINAELYSAYLYLAMTAYFEAENLRGFANWMRVQASEEMIHAMKFYDFVNERNGRVILQPIAAPQSEWNAPLAVFEDAYKHEQEVTGMINRLVDLSVKESDHATQSFLQWFVDEQVEEEANAYNVIQDLKRVAESAHGLFMLDRELGQREDEGEGEAEAEG
jgi:ferritin